MKSGEFEESLEDKALSLSLSLCLKAFISQKNKEKKKKKNSRNYAVTSLEGEIFIKKIQTPP